MTRSDRSRGLTRPVVHLLEGLLVIAFSVLVLDVLWGVFSRYVLGQQSAWTEELAIYLLVWVALLGAPVVYAERGHLGVDYLVAKMDPMAQRIAAAAVEVIVGAFAGVALLYGGWLLVTKTLATGQLCPALGLPMGYIYAITPISGLFFLLFALENLVRHITGSADEAETQSTQH